MLLDPVLRTGAVGAIASRGLSPVERTAGGDRSIRAAALGERRIV